MSDFHLHRQLEADTLHAGELGLCTVRLMNDSRFVWVILVPRIAGLREVHDLSASDRIALMEEVCDLSERMQNLWQSVKTNVAALGNMVPQLHVHIILRDEGDAAWPGPVWGVGKPEPYNDVDAAVVLEKISDCLRPS